MFFRLNNVIDHPCFKMLEIVNSLLWAVVNDHKFGPGIFPSWFKSTYNRATSVQSDLRDVHTQLLKESLAKRQAIYSQFINNNAIELICDNTAYPIESNIGWNTKSGKVLKELMITLYEKLDLAVFKQKRGDPKPLHCYYSDFIKKNSYVCPFCFINQYKNRLSPKREDLDHYFCKSIYPLIAANMHNLVPMCSECNQTYKREEKIALDGVNRVPVFYPYSDIPEIELNINCIRYPSYQEIDDNGDWSADLVCSDPAQQPKVENWNRVFDIRQRIASEVSEFHQDWIDSSLQYDDPDVFSDLAEFRQYLIDSSNKLYILAKRRNEPKTLIKAALYKYLSQHGDEKFLKSFMRQYESIKRAAA